MVGLLLDEKTLKTINTKNTKHTDMHDIVTGVITSMGYNRDGKFTDCVYETDDMYAEYDELTGTVWLHQKPKEHSLQDMLDMGLSISQINQIYKTKKGNE